MNDETRGSECGIEQTEGEQEGEVCKRRQITNHNK